MTWYIAEIIEEIRVEGEDARILRINWKLVNAADAEEAYTKALKLGEEANQEFENTDGAMVTFTFRGLHGLYEIYEDLEDGAEILYEEFEDISEEDIQSKVKSKDQLAVFEKWKRPKKSLNYMPDSVYQQMLRAGFSSGELGEEE